MLKKVKKYYNKWRSVSGFRHFGYARSHTYELVKQYLKSVKVTILLHVHVPYSPDLAHVTFSFLQNSLFYLVVVSQIPKTGSASSSEFYVNNHSMTHFWLKILWRDVLFIPLFESNVVSNPCIQCKRILQGNRKQQWCIL